MCSVTAVQSYNHSVNYWQLIHHYSFSNPPTIARLGDLNLKLTNDGAQPINYLVEEVIQHPQYKPPAKYNDVALLKLDRQVEFNEFIRPACLHQTDNFQINKTVATGWGRIDYGKRTVCFAIAMAYGKNKKVYVILM